MYIRRIPSLFVKDAKQLTKMFGNLKKVRNYNLCIHTVIWVRAIIWCFPLWWNDYYEDLRW